ncbi:hypothetical protein Tco_0994182 [Tanacetum coccineum]
MELLGRLLGDMVVMSWRIRIRDRLGFRISVRIKERHSSLVIEVLGLGMFSRVTIEGAQGYKVKKANEAILEAILKKHGGPEATCIFLDAALRTS